MTNVEQITAWHAKKPAWAANLTARDWSIAELIAEKLDAESSPEPESCTVPPAGWYCTRQAGHAGPCAAYPTE